MGESYYSILGITSSATPEQIRQAYIDLAKKYHPDSNLGSKDSDTFIIIQQAYAVLSDSKARKKYDESIKSNVSARPPIEINWLFSKEEIPQYF